MRRLLEIALGCVLLLLFAPIMLPIALAIVLEGGPPVFYRSPRIGQHGQPFDLFYFRTMRPGTTPASQRLTRVGRFLRNYSLDHLPQVFNILRGDMHLVGPRPMRPEEVDASDANYPQVLTIKPGMFGTAVLRLGKTYNATDFAARVKLDKQYLDERSTGSDVRIVLANLRAFIKSQGNIKMRGEPTLPPDRDPRT